VQGGRVVVQLVHGDREHLDRLGHERGEHRSPVGTKQHVECAPCPVVVQGRDLPRRETEQRLGARGQPLCDLVDVGTLDDEASHEHEQ